MTEHQIRQNVDANRPGPEQVEALAGEVLSVLAAQQPGAPAAQGHMSEDAAVDRLMAAVSEQDVAKRNAAVATLLRSGVAVDRLIDCYIPEAARRLGDAWCRDGMGFAEVTINTARLQGLLRHLARDMTPPAASDAMAPQVLMVVRADEHHTLGAMVATQQLRRRGVGVCVSIGRPDEDVTALAASRSFDLVMLSISGSASLDPVRSLVASIPARAGRSIPVAIGGSILGEDPEIAAKTGAAFATADPSEALRRCGLKSPAQGARLLAPSG